MDTPYPYLGVLKEPAMPTRSVVQVHSNDLDSGAILAAIDEAGYHAVTA